MSVKRKHRTTALRTLYINRMPRPAFSVFAKALLKKEEPACKLNLSRAEHTFVMNAYIKSKLQCQIKATRKRYRKYDKEIKAKRALKESVLKNLPESFVIQPAIWGEELQAALSETTIHRQSTQRSILKCQSSESIERPLYVPCTSSYQSCHYSNKD